MVVGKLTRLVRRRSRSPGRGVEHTKADAAGAREPEGASGGRATASPASSDPDAGPIVGEATQGVDPSAGSPDFSEVVAPPPSGDEPDRAGPDDMDAGAPVVAGVDDWDRHVENALQQESREYETVSNIRKMKYDEARKAISNTRDDTPSSGGTQPGEGDADGGGGAVRGAPPKSALRMSTSDTRQKESDGRSFSDVAKTGLARTADGAESPEGSPFVPGGSALTAAIGNDTDPTGLGSEAVTDTGRIADERDEAATTTPTGMTVEVTEREEPGSIRDPSEKPLAAPDVAKTPSPPGPVAQAYADESAPGGTKLDEVATKAGRGEDPRDTGREVDEAVQAQSESTGPTLSSTSQAAHEGMESVITSLRGGETSPEGEADDTTGTAGTEAAHDDSPTQSVGGEPQPGAQTGEIAEPDETMAHARSDVEGLVEELTTEPETKADTEKSGSKTEKPAADPTTRVDRAGADTLAEPDKLGSEPETQARTDDKILAGGVDAGETTAEEPDAAGGVDAGETTAEEPDAAGDRAGQDQSDAGPLGVAASIGLVAGPELEADPAVDDDTTLVATTPDIETATATAPPETTTAATESLLAEPVATETSGRDREATRSDKADPTDTGSVQPGSAGADEAAGKEVEEPPAPVSFEQAIERSAPVDSYAEDLTRGADAIDATPDLPDTAAPPVDTELATLSAPAELVLDDLDADDTIEESEAPPPEVDE